MLKLETRMSLINALIDKLPDFADMHTIEQKRWWYGMHGDLVLAYAKALEEYQQIAF